MKISGAKIVVETLIEQGCDTIFGYPGGQVINLFDELYLSRDRIRHVLTAHEQGAAHAADGYARATGKVGVVIATSGPGATNLVTGIATAYLDSVPMVAITGNVPCSLIGRDSFQEVDIVGITMPVTKHNFIVKDIRELADVLRTAFKIAKSGRPGPVLVDIPKDVQTAVWDFEPKADPVRPYPLRFASESKLRKAAEMINSAERPYIYFGGGIISGKDRLVKIDTKDDELLMKVIQTDAAINEGNSGGPLCNILGQVIGITSSKLIGDGVEGMGFSIPMATVNAIIDKLEAGKEIERPYLGVQLADVNNAYNLRYTVYKE